MGLYGRGVLMVGVCAATVTVGALAASRAPVAASGAGRTEACPTLSRASALPVWQKGGVAFGDLEGSGYSGRASIRYAQGASSICGFVLVVKTHRGARAVRVPEMAYDKGSSVPIRRWGYPEPYIASVVGLSDSGRSQFVVTHWHGRSTAFMSLYGLLDGRFARLPFHDGAVARNELSLGGTIYGRSSIQCVRGGTLSVLSLRASFEKGTRSGTFIRRTYRLGRGGFSLTKTRTTEGTEASINALAERAGFNNRPFAGCIVPHRPTA